MFAAIPFPALDPVALQIGPIDAGIGQQGWGKTAVQISLEIAPVLGVGSGVAQHQLQLQAMALEGPRPAAPVLEQPGAIALIAVGACHHEHLGRVRIGAHQRKARAWHWISGSA